MAVGEGDALAKLANAEGTMDTQEKSTADVAQKAALTTLEAKGTQSGSIIKCVVVENIVDVQKLREFIDDEANEGFVEKLKDVAVIKNAPANSLLVARLTDQTDAKYELAIPMFGSHLMLAANRGEQVWCFDDKGRYLYWMGRIGALGLAEDLNFTDKNLELNIPMNPPENAEEKAKIKTGEKKRTVPQQQDGLGGEHGGTGNSPAGASPKDLAEPPFLDSTLFQREPISRFSARASDVGLQGGTGGGGRVNIGTFIPFTKNDTGNLVENKQYETYGKNKAAIDIMVGVGTQEGDPTPSTESLEGSEPERVKGKFVQNADGTIEIEKMDHQNEAKPNPAEGNPCTHSDASRIVLLEDDTIDDFFPVEYKSLKEGSVESLAGPSIAMKSNHIRVLSREDGSIRISQESGAQIVLQPDGTVHITGGKVFIGTEASGGSGPGPGGSEPYVKYSELKNYLYDIHGALNSFCGELIGHAIPWFGQSPQITSAATALKTHLGIYKTKIDKMQSDKIFGE